MKRIPKKLLALLLSVMMLMSVLSACGSTGADAGETATPETTETVTPTTRTITDYDGNQVEIPNEVNSICATFPAIEAMILMLGQPEKLVATTGSTPKNAWFVKAFPAIVDLPQPFTNLSDGNVEEVMNIAPDVIITTSANRDTFLSAGLTPVVVGTGSVESLKFTMTLLGEILGGDAADKAAQLCAYYNENISLVTSRTESIADADRPRVFYAADGVLNTEGSGSIVTEWIEMAGGINVAAENGIEGGFIDISQEQLLEWDPDIIVCRDADQKDAYAADPTLSQLSAVKNDRVYVNPKSVFVWCVRSADEALQPLWAATIIQPELFSDLDIVQATRDFHQDFYGLTLTDEEIAGILSPTVTQ